VRSVLALDIGGTKLASGVVTSDGAVHGFSVQPTDRDRGPDPVIADLFALGRRSIEAAAAEGIEPPRAVGISCGGPLDAAAGVLVNPLHLPGWIDIPIVERAGAEYGLPAALENDATLAALAEYRHGAAQGARSMIYLTISTGIGGGAVFDGQLYRGAAGNGGEFGHITVVRGGRPCLCGRRGCLEAYASGTFIGVRADEAIAGGEPTTLTAPATAEQVARAAAAGDAVAGRVWDETTALLGQAVTDLVNVLEPDVVVLGGGVTRSGAQLLDPVRELVTTSAMPPAAAAARIELAALGDVVCVVGAGELALDLVAQAG
jgi:glucokinase